MKKFHLVPSKQAQSGQAILLIAMATIALSAVLGLAIDGGGLFFLHRDSQNAVDAALVASLYAMCTGNRSDANYEQRIIDAGIEAARVNGFQTGSNGAVVTVDPTYQPPGTTRDYYVRVSILATKPSYFIQLVYREPLTVFTAGAGYCQPTRNNLLPPNSAIISFRKTSECNLGNGESIGNTGTSDIYVHNSGIFANSDNASCAIMGRGSSSFTVEGTCTAVGNFNSSDLDCDSEVEGADQLVDANPLSDIDPPECVAGAHYTAGGAAPGTYASWDISGEFHLEPGIYCVNDIRLGSHGHLTGDGVVIYMPPDNGGITVNGHGSGNLKAPTAATCIEDVTCQWIDLLLWSDVTNPDGNVIENDPIHMNGGSDDQWWGMVYAPGSECTMEGNQDTIFHGVYACYSVRGAGTQALDIYYELPDFLQIPPKVSISE